MSRQVMTLPTFTLESGVTLRDVPIAYHTWGKLNRRGDNCVLVCHALTGDTDASDWWADLFGPACGLDPDHDYIVCANAIGSPYGTVSPLSINPQTGKEYGPGFPPATLRDTVALHRRLLEALGVRRVKFAIGGSMGGMQALEWAFHKDLVYGIVPIGVGGRHSAWCVAWSWTQRHAIALDPNFHGGHYATGEGPSLGLGLARMIAMITYRSFSTFQERFGRNRSNGEQFDMTSYLAHQGEKLVNRFDANCYLALMDEMDTHDVARERGVFPEVLGQIAQPALVIGIDSDLLYPLEEQRELAAHMPNAELATIVANHGHDSFLIEGGAISQLVRDWRDRVLEPTLAAEQ